MPEKQALAGGASTALAEEDRRGHVLAGVALSAARASCDGVGLAVGVGVVANAAAARE